jgi:acetyltransferase-like isoleucine patch superfamily enzyme
MINISNLFLLKGYIIKSMRIFYWKSRYGKKFKVNKTLNCGSNFTLVISNSASGFFGEEITVDQFTFINILGEGSSFNFSNQLCFKKFCNINHWGKEIKIGHNVLFNNYCSINVLDNLEIGDNTWFGEGVKIYDHNHRYKNRKIPFTDQGFSSGRIIIGSNVWVGSNTVILQNVTIGDNCVIGANCLIHRSVPPNTIVKSNTRYMVEEIPES